MPSHRTSKNLEATQFLSTAVLDDTSFAHARSSQTTISTPTLYSEVAIANKNNLQHRRNTFRVSTLPHGWPSAKRQPVTVSLAASVQSEIRIVVPTVDIYDLCHFHIPQCHSVFWNAVLFCKMSVFRDMLCFFSRVVCVSESGGVSCFVKVYSVLWNIAVFFLVMLSCFWPSG